jgi:hypothetical protein
MDLENEIYKIKEEEEMLIKRQNKKEANKGYTINTTPKL